MNKHIMIIENKLLLFVLMVFVLASNMDLVFGQGKTGIGAFLPEFGLEVNESRYESDVRTPGGFGTPVSSPPPAPPSPPASDVPTVNAAPPTPPPKL